jgi:hypothetical protein
MDPPSSPNSIVDKLGACDDTINLIAIPRPF